MPGLGHMPTLEPSYPIYMDSEWGGSGVPKKRMLYCQKKKEMNIGQTTDAYCCNMQSSLAGSKAGAVRARGFWVQGHTLGALAHPLLDG